MPHLGEGGEGLLVPPQVLGHEPPPELDPVLEEGGHGELGRPLGVAGRLLVIPLPPLHRGPHQKALRPGRFVQEGELLLRGQKGLRLLVEAGVGLGLGGLDAGRGPKPWVLGLGQEGEGLLHLGVGVLAQDGPVAHQGGGQRLPVLLRPGPGLLPEARQEGEAGGVLGEEVQKDPPLPGLAGVVEAAEEVLPGEELQGEAVELPRGLLGQEASQGGADEPVPHPLQEGLLRLGEAL